MSQRHAGSKAGRAAIAAAKNSSPPAKRVGFKPSENSDVDFARRFVEAALHGHSPLWKFKGWKSPGSDKSKNPKVNPHKYLSRRLIEGVLPPTPPRKFLRQQAKLEPLRKYTRPFSSSASPRSYKLQDEPEEEDFAEEDPSDDAEGLPSLSLLAAKRQLQPGDWVQMRLFNQSSGAIYLAEDKVNASRGGRRFLVHGFGNVLHSVRQEDILFTIPGVVPAKTAKLATRILGLSPQEFIEHLEEEDEPSSGASPVSEIVLDDQSLWKEYGIEHGADDWKATFAAKSECVAALRDMKLKQEKARAAIATKGPRRLYDHYVQGQDVHITTLDAYTILFKSKTDINIDDLDSTSEKHRHYLLALHDALMDDSEHFVLHSFGTLLNSEFRVRPREELERLREVREWVRRDTKEVQNFCTKARDISTIVHSARKGILDSAKSSQHTPTSRPGISDGIPWSYEDVKIIRFLEDSLDMRRKLQANPFDSAASLLLRRALGTDNGQLENSISDDVSPILQARRATINFLKSIGVYTEWENLTLRDREAKLNERQKVLSSYKPESTLAEENLDGLDSQRHDFGQLPVYVIDDIGASELDDGISIESPQRDSHGKQTYWVHVHIADPTASLSPTSVLAQQARSFATAVYLPEFVSPMFPDSAMNHYKWSLGSEARNQGQRVLTFSAKIDEDGDVLEKRVRPAVVNNVYTTTYEKVNEMLGVQSSTARSSGHDLVLTWPSSSMPPAQKHNRSLSSLPPDAAGTFKTLQRLSRLLLKQRVATGHTTWNRSSNESNLILGPRPFSTSLATDFSAAAFASYPNPPHLAFILPSPGEGPSRSESESGNLVAEFMILAGRVAASHLTSRNVPALYRAQDAPGANSPEALEEFLASRNRENGLTSFEDQLEKGITFLPAYFSSTPSDHWSMGIKSSSGGYVQATSPLRRYNDMMIHWQLKSTLKEGKPIFSMSDIDDHIKRYTPFDKLLKNLDKRSRNFWKLFVLDKKLQTLRRDPTSDLRASELLFNGLHGKVISHKLDYASLKVVARLLIPELGGMMATLVLDPKEYGDISTGQQFKVQISDIILDDYSKMFVRLSK